MAQMKNIIKLSSEHYVVVDDSEIKQNDIVCEKLLTGGYELFTIQTLNDIDTNNQFKVTHSTQPLEFEWDRGVKDKFFDKIKPLSLSEVEEAVNGYSIEKMAESAFAHPVFGKYKVGSIGYYNGYKDGFKAHQELVKDKVFTIEDVRKAMWEVDRLKTTNLTTKKFAVLVDNYIQALLPKNEWEVEFVDGKIKIKQ